MQGVICPSRTVRGSARHAPPPVRRRRGRSSPARRSRRRQPNHEARAGNTRLAPGAGRASPVLGPDAAAMGFDDLFRDRKPEAGVLAKTLRRAVGVKTLEDFLQRLVTYAGPVVVDHDLDFGPDAAAYHADLAARLRE